MDKKWMDGWMQIVVVEMGLKLYGLLLLQNKQAHFERA